MCGPGLEYSEFMALTGWWRAWNSITRRSGLERVSKHLAPWLRLGVGKPEIEGWSLQDRPFWETPVERGEWAQQGMTGGGRPGLGGRSK